MKQLFTLLFAISTFIVSSQTYGLLLNPSKDASVGFHDGYNTANTNYGDAVHNSAFSQPSYCCPGENAGWGLIDFDLSSIPEDAIILTAKLSLYAFTDGISDYITDGHVGDNTSFLCRIIEPWEEMEVTWNTSPSYTYSNRVKLNASDSLNQDYININVKNLVQDMVVNPYDSYGFVVKLKNESPVRGMMFCSSDVPDSAKWPKLKITYMLPASLTAANDFENETKMIYNSINQVIQFDIKPKQEDDFTIVIYDLMGQKIYQSETTHIKDQEINYDLNVSDFNLASGIYIISIQFNGYSESYKFVNQ